MIKKINYSTLINKYQKDINDKLRGFGLGENFMELFVPDEDINKSIFNLVDSFFESKIDDLDLTIDREHYDKLDFNLLSKLDILTETKTNDKENKKFFLALRNIISKYPSIKIHSYSEIPKEKNKSVKVQNIYESSFKKKDILTTHNLIIENKYDYNKELKDNSILALHTSLSKEYELFFHIDTEGIVKNTSFVMHDKTSDKLHMSILNSFCEYSINLPIQEVSEHGVIYTEFHLRKNRREVLASGISFSLLVDPFFSSLENSVRNIYTEYRKKNKIDVHKSNRYYPPLSLNWKKKDSKEKTITVNKELKKYLNMTKEENIDIRLIDIQYGYRINIEILTKDTFFDKPSFVFNLEIYMKKAIDQRIEVFYKEIIDMNKLRLKNSPQSV